MDLESRPTDDVLSRLGLVGPFCRHVCRPLLFCVETRLVDASERVDLYVHVHPRTYINHIYNGWRLAETGTGEAGYLKLNIVKLAMLSTIVESHDVGLVAHFKMMGPPSSLWNGASNLVRRLTTACIS